MQLNSWAGNIDLTKLNIFRHESDGTWTAIPYQIDKRRKINLKNNIYDTSDIAGNTDLCEYGYFRELSIASGGTGDNFASNTLKPTDEIVFMLKDAGGTQAPRTSWLAGDVDTNRQEIALTDPRNGASRYVYVFNFPNGIPSSGTNARSTNRYVSYTEDANPSTNCSLTTCSGCTQVYPCGTVEGSTTYLGGLKTHRVHFLKNWVTDGYQINSGSSFLNDILNRFEFNYASETEDTWSAQGRPRTLGVYSTSGSVQNLVRVVRGVQGAQSGRHTTKYEFVYATNFITRMNLRVHALPALNAKINHDSGLVGETGTNRAQLWTETSFGQTSAAPKDDIDGADFNTEDLNSAAYADWTEVSSPLRGRYVHFLREPRPVPKAAAYYSYHDKTTAGSIGLYGRKWEGVGSTQDGRFNDVPNQDPIEINDGGCGPDNDPESTALNFARFEYWMFPSTTPSDPTALGTVFADDLADNIAEPMTSAVRTQSSNSSDPPPPTLCTPGLTPSTNNKGAVHLQIIETNCDSSLAYRLYRGIGSSGPLYILKDVGAGSSLDDIAVGVGETYRYAVSAYDVQNNEGSRSTASSITVTDTTAPPVPVAYAATHGNGTAAVTWAQNTARDIQGYDIHLSSGGGSYVKQNGSPYSASSTLQWALVGLTNGVQYCFKIAAVDLNGNTSSLSTEVCTTPSQ